MHQDEESIDSALASQSGMVPPNTVHIELVNVLSTSKTYFICFRLVIRLQFGQVSYTFPENISNSTVEVMIENYNQLEIRSDVSVSLVTSATNASINGILLFMPHLIALSSTECMATYI